MDLEETAQTPLDKNLTMLADFYEITMANGYPTNDFEDKIVYFDMLFGRIPDGGGFAAMAGVQQLAECLQDLSLTPQDLDCLRFTGEFSQAFVNYLTSFHFKCDVWTIPEDTPIFPDEPVVTVCGPVIQAQFIETIVLLCVNHQTLIAAKVNRVVRAASGRSVMGFGSYRAQDFDGAIYGIRTTYIGGCTGTACATCERGFGIPAMGTMAHNQVQLFDTELDVFRMYAYECPNQCVLLVDIYNVLQSGIPNAIHIFNEELVPQGLRPAGIRIDSGDITYFFRRARRVLDTAGSEDCDICASNSLDEYIIRGILMRDAQVDSFGVGGRMITSASEPVFGGVYKLVAVEREGGSIEPKTKISENVVRITTPNFKHLWRLFDRYSGEMIAGVITLHGELVDDEMPYVIFDPECIWKRKRVENFHAVPLMTQIFKAGQCITQPRNLHEIRGYCAAQVDMLWEEVIHFESPHRYCANLSRQLWQIKDRLITSHNFGKPTDLVRCEPPIRKERAAVSPPSKQGRTRSLHDWKGWGKMELVVKRFEELAVNELYEILKLRVSVFVVEQDCPYREIDDKDRQVLHVYLKDESGVQVYLRVIEKRAAFDEVPIGRVIAIKRQCGMDSRVLAEGIRTVKNQLKIDAIRIEAQTYTKELYEKQGFQQILDEFLEDGIPHVPMRLDCRQTTA